MLRSDLNVFWMYLFSCGCKHGLGWRQTTSSMLSSTVMKQILKRLNKVYQTKMYFTVKCEVLIKPTFGKREFFIHLVCPPSQMLECFCIFRSHFGISWAVEGAFTTCVDFIRTWWRSFTTLTHKHSNSGFVPTLLLFEEESVLRWNSCHTLCSISAKTKGKEIWCSRIHIASFSPLQEALDLCLRRLVKKNKKGGER